MLNMYDSKHIHLCHLKGEIWCPLQVEFAFILGAYAMCVLSVRDSTDQKSPWP